MTRTTALSRLRTRIATHRADRETQRRFASEIAAYSTPTDRDELYAILARHAPEQTHDIEVELTRPDLGTVEIAVRDHGLGIPPEKRAEIFDRYYRAHAEQHASGMGLGLYISREIVQQHGGQIQAEFPPDGGSRFVVQLPTDFIEPPDQAAAPAN